MASPTELHGIDPNHSYSAMPVARFAEKADAIDAAPSGLDENESLWACVLAWSADSLREPRPSNLRMAS